MQLVESFEVLSLVDGKRYTLEVRQAISSSDLEGKHRRRGILDFRLQDGRWVAPIDEDNFEIQGTGERFKRVIPVGKQ
jgi:hypothetical protein